MTAVPTRPCGWPQSAFPGAAEVPYPDRRFEARELITV